MVARRPPAPPPPPPQAQALTQMLSARAPGVPALRAGRGQLMRARSELCPDPHDHAARMAAGVRARRWAVPTPVSAAASTSGSGLGLAAGPLQMVRLRFEGAVDTAKLRWA